MVRKAVRSVWENLGVVLSVYAVYKQLQTMKEARSELYSHLSVEQQAEWDKYFGKPAEIQVTSPFAAQTVPAGAGAINHLVAGT